MRSLIPFPMLASPEVIVLEGTPALALGIQRMHLLFQT